MKIVTIDGTAGSGKSSVAKELSRRLGYRHINTGSIFRGVTLLGLESGIDLNNHQLLGEIAEKMNIHFVRDGIFVNGKERTSELFVPAVSVAVGPATINLRVRRAYESILYAEVARAFDESVDIVAEGRDVGKLLHDKAAVRVYLTADISIRVHRSLSKLYKVWDEEVQMTEELRLMQRDQRDFDLGNGPQAFQFYIDTTRLTLSETMAKIEVQFAGQ